MPTPPVHRLPDLPPDARPEAGDTAFRKAGPTDPIVMECPYCPGHLAECVDGRTVYPHRRDLWQKRFWRCANCTAYVGCHPPADGPRGGVGDGTVPLGRLADAELRLVRTAAHQALDSLFKDGRMTRREVYKWLSEALGLPSKDCHISHMDVAGCQAVIAAVQARRTT